ncbi:HXXEE domain-containing protein [Streptococcus salivarius]
MSIVQFYFLFPALFMLHELEEIVWMPSFIKKISTQYPNNRILSYYTPFAFNFIVLEQFLILMTLLYLSYQFNYYTIYTTIIIAYIYHVLGHLIQTIVIRKYVPGLLTGILTSLFTLCDLKNEFPIKLYGYSLFTLLVIILNLVVSFVVLHKKSLKLR